MEACAGRAALAVYDHIRHNDVGGEAEPVRLIWALDPAQRNTVLAGKLAKYECFARRVPHEDDNPTISGA